MTARQLSRRLRVREVQQPIRSNLLHFRIDNEVSDLLGAWRVCASSSLRSTKRIAYVPGRPKQAAVSKFTFARADVRGDAMMAPMVIVVLKTLHEAVF